MSLSFFFQRINRLKERKSLEENATVCGTEEDDEEDHEEEEEDGCRRKQLSSFLIAGRPSFIHSPITSSLFRRTIALTNIHLPSLPLPPLLPPCRAPHSS